MKINLTTDQKIRETEKAINLNICGFDCWLPKKVITFKLNGKKYNIEIDVPDDFKFKLQKYSPKEDIIKTAVEIQKMIIEYNIRLKNINIKAPSEVFDLSDSNFRDGN